MEAITKDEDLGEVIDTVKQLIAQADKKINEASQKIKTAESVLSTAS